MDSHGAVGGMRFQILKQKLTIIHLEYSDSKRNIYFYHFRKKNKNEKKLLLPCKLLLLGLNFVIFSIVMRLSHQLWRSA